MFVSKNDTKMIVANNPCKQFEPRLDLTKRLLLSDTLVMFLKWSWQRFNIKIYMTEMTNNANLSSMQRVTSLYHNKFVSN